MVILTLYLWVVFSLYVSFSVKPNGFVAGFGQFLKWMIFAPIIFIFTIIFGFIFRNELKWLRTKWFCVSCKQFWKIMVNNEIQKMIMKK